MSGIPAARRVVRSDVCAYLFLTALVSMMAAACERPAASTAQAQRATESREWFTDGTAQSRLDFVHVNGMTGQFFYPEVIAPGVALFDYDNDGDLDLFLVQSGSLDAANRSADSAASHRSRLYRNDLQVRADGTRSPTFVDVTAASGLLTSSYGMGATTGDYDNDGCVDLYVTALGRNQLFHNNCDGTFTDVTARAGLADSGWSVSAAFVDIDRDGWLDLYVGHYLNWDPSLNTPCLGPSGKRVYCAPRVYVAQQSHLFRNQHDGTFADITASAGLATQFGPALGVVTADFNHDGWLDFYVANDGQENQLWINRRDGTFTDVGLAAGCAWSEPGQTKAGMGVDAGDFDDDGDDDLFVTNLSGEGVDLYVNDGTGTFDARSAASGLRYPSLPFTGFGTSWLDVDNDGRLDVLTVNGTVQRIDALVRAHDPLPLRQRKQLFRNRGDGRFDDVTPRAGAAFARLDVGRGAAFGDLDNDGDTDVVVANNGGAAQVLLNAIGSAAHWIGLRLVAAVPSAASSVNASPRVRDMLGARVAILRDGLPTRWRRAHVDGSYASASDPRVLVGLGSSPQRPRVRVIWPDGRTEDFASVAIDRYTTLIEGSSR